MSGSASTDLEFLDFPVYITERGGLARLTDHGQYVWYEVPKEFPDFNVGDLIPLGWSTTAANQLARLKESNPNVFDDWEDYDDRDEWDDGSL